MRLPRLTIRRLMIAVAVAGVIAAAVSAIIRHRERSKVAAVRVINHQATDLSDVRVIGAGQERTLPRVPAGTEVEIPIVIESEATLSVEAGGRRIAVFGQVRGGSRPTVRFGE